MIPRAAMNIRRKNNEKEGQKIQSGHPMTDCHSLIGSQSLVAEAKLGRGIGPEQGHLKAKS
ncbi:MAG: hypothetical protein AMJ56_01635 [Anaerolineae bacterium SG8_19]|jgi:hypothetical protein|nr:MAG: hypothetical protein AMJ56_01635 [Anaerolineae bacterium SG8_19]